MLIVHVDSEIVPEEDYPDRFALGDVATQARAALSDHTSDAVQ